MLMKIEAGELMKVDLTRPQIKATKWALAHFIRAASWQDCVQFFGNSSAAKAAFRSYTKLDAAYYGISEEEANKL